MTESLPPHVIDLLKENLGENYDHVMRIISRPREVRVVEVQGFDAREFSGCRVSQLLWRTQRKSRSYYTRSFAINPKRESAKEIVLRESPADVVALSNSLFTPDGMVGPAVVYQREIDISACPDYLKKTVNNRLCRKYTPGKGPVPIFPSFFSVEAQSLAFEPDSDLLNYGGRAVWLKSPRLAVEEIFCLMAPGVETAAWVANDFFFRRSGQDHNQVKIEIYENYTRSLSYRHPFYVSKKGSELGWDDFIAEMLLPEPIFLNSD